MAGRYRGYFTNLDGKLYRVSITKSGSTGNYVEVPMSYETPFVAKYEASDNPFAPTRQSTAEITFINSSYMEDVLPSKATETEVEMYNTSTGKIEWLGYLKPNVYNCGFERENEEIKLEASDAIASLQYKDYKAINDDGTWQGAGMANVYQILKNICSGTCIRNIYWAQDKKDADGSLIGLTDIVLSEKNFFSSDDNEPWKCNEVLEEICKYIGVTAMQVGKSLYLVDFSEHKTHNMLSFKIYYFSNDTTSTVIEGIEAYADTPEAYMLNGSDVSFSPVYNKATVKASLYTPDNVLPDIFSDDENDVTYRLADSSKVIMAHRPTNVWKRTDKKGKEQDDGDDAASAFPIKLVDVKGWESFYYSANTDGSLAYKNLSEDKYNSESAVTQYIGGTIIEKAQIKASHKYYDVEGTPEFDRALFLRTDNHMVDDKEFGYDEWYKEDWQKQVSGMCQYVISGDTLNKYDSLFATLGDYRLGIPADSADTYLVLNVSAMWQRYPQPYVNSDWSSDALGHPNENAYTRYYTPTLNFMLTCGSQYYNGQEWQDTRCGFRVPLAHSTEEKKKKIDGFNEVFAANNGDDWNREMTSYNNIMYLNWSTDKGYKISLKGLKDRSGKIYISFLMPNNIVSFWDGRVYPERLWESYCSKYTINGAVWITSFSLTMARDGSPAGEKDIVYENVIDEANVNELSEEDFKVNTAVPGAKASYSFAEKATGGWFQGWKQTSTGSEFLCPEEQWIQKQVEHFGKPRREITLTLSLKALPYGRVREGFTGKEYAVMGTEIDYASARQTITMKEIN